MRYVSARGRSALLRYQYRGRDCSLVYRFLLTPMNNVLIHWIPMWMAPNLVTVRTPPHVHAPQVRQMTNTDAHLGGGVAQVTGVAVALVAYAALAWWCPALTCGAMPGWLYVLDAACTFVYQVWGFPAPAPPRRCAESRQGHARVRTRQRMVGVLPIFAVNRNPRGGGCRADARRRRACGSSVTEAPCALGWRSVSGRPATRLQNEGSRSRRMTHRCGLSDVGGGQTLDNLDGKQARRTGSSSPLGLLFDHGCDAFNTTVGAVNQVRGWW